MTTKKKYQFENLVGDTWLSRYPIPMETPYGQGLEFIVHNFRKTLIEREYIIIAKLRTSVNPTSNAIFERI